MRAPDATLSLVEGGEGLLTFDELGVEEPRDLRALCMARCWLEMAAEISSLVSIKVRRVSWSGAGCVE